MPEWKTMLEKIPYDPAPLKFTPPNKNDVPLEEVFPDVRELLIAKRLEEWGIDAGKIPIRSSDETVAVMAAYPQGVVYVHIPAMERQYPKDRHQYVILAHELAHMLQFVEDRVDWKRANIWTTLHEWASLEHERDAVRWQAREAKRMGISQQAFESSVIKRGLPLISRELISLTRPVYAGTYPEEHGVRPMFRRPVRVQRHLRRKR